MNILKSFFEKDLTSQFYLIGKYFLFLNIAKFILLYLPIEPIYITEVFWYCNFFSFVLAFSLLFSSKRFLKRIATYIFTTAIVAQTMWIIYFILHSLNIYSAGRILNLHFKSITEMNFLEYIIYFLSISEHVLLIPIAFYIIYRLGFDDKAYKFILKTGFLFLTFSFFISTRGTNLNCMRQDCDLPEGNLYDYTFNFSDFIYYSNQIIIWFVLTSISFFVFRFIFKNKKYQNES